MYNVSHQERNESVTICTREVVYSQLKYEP